jgi:hypothetical protein
MERFEQEKFNRISKPQSVYNSVAAVLEGTMPTERPPLFGEVSANFLRIEGVEWSAQRILTAVLSAF